MENDGNNINNNKNIKPTGGVNNIQLKILIQTLASLHCYLLHTKDQLYRNRRNKNRFGTQMGKKSKNKSRHQFFCDFVKHELTELHQSHKISMQEVKSLLKFIDDNEYDTESLKNDIFGADNYSNNIKQNESNLINGNIMKNIFKKYHQKDVTQINFGISVLEWIQYNEKPRYNTFDDEILKHPHTTIEQDILSEIKNQCKIKIKGDIVNYYNLNEMLALKLYSDCTTFTTTFRKASWSTTSKHMKKSFYWWAINIYFASLYNAKPPREQKLNTRKATPLFHGLNDVFIVNDLMPIYNGQFSTTVASTVAEQFAGGKGILWTLQPTYSNPFQFIIGIDMKWISAFPNESEFLLTNQRLPISNTRTFEKNNDNLVDLLLYTLKSYKLKIENKSRFYRNLGIEFNEAWVPIIRNHKLFCQTINDNPSKTILHRLINELKMKELLDEYVILTSKFQRFSHDSNAVHGSKYVSFKLKKQQNIDCFKQCQYQIQECNNESVKNDILTLQHDDVYWLKIPQNNFATKYDKLNKTDDNRILMLQYNDTYWLKLSKDTLHTKYNIYVINNQLFGVEDGIFLQQIQTKEFVNNNYNKHHQRINMDMFWMCLLDNKIEQDKINVLKHLLTDQEYDSDTMINEIYSSSHDKLNINLNIDDTDNHVSKYLNLFKSYIEYHCEYQINNILIELNDDKYNKLVQQLILIQWHKYHILVALKWFYKYRKLHNIYNIKKNELQQLYETHKIFFGFTNIVSDLSLVVNKISVDSRIKKEVNHSSILGYYKLPDQKPWEIKEDDPNAPDPAKITAYYCIVENVPKDCDQQVLMEFLMDYDRWTYVTVTKNENGDDDDDGDGDNNDDNDDDSDSDNDSDSDSDSDSDDNDQNDNKLDYQFAKIEFDTNKALQLFIDDINSDDGLYVMKNKLILKKQDKETRNRKRRRLYASHMIV